MSRSIRSLIKDKKGVAALEYSILAGLVVLGVVAAINTTNIQANVLAIFAGINNALTASQNNGNANP